MSYEQFISPHDPNQDSLERLANMAVQLGEAEDEVARIQEELKAAQAVVRGLTDKDIPELMADIGMDSFTTKSGLKITVKEKIHASIPKARLLDAIKWLEDNGHGGLIKSEVAAVFGREDRDMAQELLERLQGEGMMAKEVATVHPQTLMKLLNDLDGEGVDFPMDIFGAYRRRTAKVTAAKA